MKPIRIMHVVRTLATGGTETVVRKLVSTLNPERFQQTVCTLVDNDNAQMRDTICFGLAPTESRFLVPRLTRLFHKEKPDVVHSRNWATVESVIAARLAAVHGIVHSEHGRDSNTMGAQPFRRRLWRRLSYAAADRVFCVSEELKQHYCRQLRMKSSAFRVIPNGVDTLEFRPESAMRSAMRNRMHLAPGAVVVGSVGRLDPVKDHFTLIRAADAALRRGIDLHLVIAGDGPQRPALQNELSQRPDLQKRTVLAGEVSNVCDWLNAFDIFVLPSLTEGMSNTLLEAMAVGIAPVATSVGGNGEVIEHNHSGLLVPPGDVGALEGAVVRLSADRDRRQDLAHNARDRVLKNFNIERTLKQYEELYSSLMSHTPPTMGVLHASNTKLFG